YFGPHIDLSALRRELQCIGQKVQEHLLHFALVGANRPETAVDRASDRDRAPLGSLAHKDQRVLDGGGQIELRRLQFHPPCLDLGQIEDVVDEGEEMPSRLQNVAQVFRL